MAEQNPELGYGNIQKGSPESFQKPPVGLLKQILSRSKDSEQFSPYKKSEPKPVQLKKAKQAPLAPYVEPEQAPIQTDILAPVKEFAKQSNENYNAAIENTIAKKFPAGTSQPIPVDVYKKNLEEGLTSGDFKIVQDEAGYPDVIRTAPSVIGAIADGWNGYFTGIKEGLDAYNPFIAEEEKIKQREYKRRADALILREEESKAREYGGLAGQTGAQLVTTLLPIGEAAIVAKIAKVGMDAIKVTTVNSVLNAFTSSISQANQAEDEAYNISRDNGLSEQESYNIAKANRATYLASGALEGAVSALADAQIAKVFGSATPKAADGFLNATKAYLSKAKLPAASLGLDAGVAGMMSIVRDLSTEQTTGADLDVMQRAWENIKGELVAGGAIATIASGTGAASRKIDKWYQSQATNYLSTLDRTFVENELKDRQQKGIITEDDVKKQLEKLDQWNEVRKENPNIPEEKAPTIIGLILKKKNLSEAFNNADESSKLGILIDIKNIDNRIQEAYNNPEPLAGEVDEDGNVILQTKTKENATPTSEEQQQKGGTISGVSQYQGTEGEQAPTTNEADNRNRPVSSTQEQIVPESFNTEEGKNAWNTVNKVIEESRKRGRDENTVKDNAIKNVQISKAYELADDVTRNKMIADINKELFGKSAKSAPSVDVLLGNVKNKLDITESSALKRLLKRQEQASRETIKWVNDTRASISKGLSELASKGVIKTSQLQSILKKYDKVNLSSNDAVNKFVNYTSKVIEDANYSKNLEDANSLKTSIKKYASSKNAQQNLSAAAKDFLSINPEDVSDINAYKKTAESIVAGLKPSRAAGLAVNFNQPFSTEAVSSYVDKTKADIENAAKESKLSDYQDLVDRGVISKDMPFDEMETIISDIESNQKPEGIKDKERYIRAYTNERFNSLSAFVKSMESKNPEQVKKINDLLKIGIDDMKIQDAYRAVESLQNYLTNGETSGLDAVLHNYYGYKNSELLAKRGFQSRPIKFLFSRGLGKAMFENFTTLPVFYDALFGNKKAQIFRKAMGLTDIENGRAKAVSAVKSAENEYINKFKNVTPNNKNFYSQDNVYERGMYAFVRRNQGLSDSQNQTKFESRKNMVKQSIDELIKNGGKDEEIGNIYNNIYNTILKDAKNISDVEKAMHPVNKKAVEWWTDKFNQHYPELRNVSLSVYNQELNADNNYNPDIYKSLNEKADLESDPFDNGAFASFADNIVTKKSGTLEKTKQINELPSGKYIDLNFDYNNINALDKALTDIYTAKYIRQAKSFLNSDSYYKIMNKSDADLSKKRVASYVKRTRGLERIDPSEFGKARQMFNEFTKLIVSRSLGSIFMPIKQTVPALTNTLINAGANINFSDNSNPDVRDFINRSNRAIANRGIESDAMIESNDKLLLNAQKGVFDKTLSTVKKLNEGYLKLLIEKPDAYAARLSFMAYYRKSLIEQGIDPSKINWKTHEVNEKAADYAQHMVDVQQNATDRNLQGEIMASRDAKISFIRNMVMPLSNFVMNQKARMYSDFVNAFSKTNTIEDRKIAVRSLAGLTAEMAAYSSVVYSSNLLLNTIADSIAGVPLSKEEEDKRQKDASRNAATNYLNDLISPFPMLNVGIDAGVNAVMNSTFQKDTPPELRFNLYEGDGKKWYEDFGLTGIGIKKGVRAYEMAKEAGTGNVAKSYFGKEYVKTIADEDIPLAQAAAAFNILTQIGVLPTDVGNITNKIMKGAEKRAMGKKQMEMYQELRGAGGTEITGEALDITKSISRAVTIKDPEAKASYLISIADKVGIEKMAETIDNLSEVQTPSGKYPMNSIMDNATSANIEAKMTKDPLKIEFGRLFSVGDQKARAYKIMMIRDNMSKEDFYSTLKWAMNYGLLNDTGLQEFGSLLSKKIGQNSEEFQMALNAIEEE